MIVAVDVETTGLHPYDGHLLLEIYVSIRESHYPFKEIAPPFHRYIQHDREVAYGRADDYVKRMHTETGLWSKLEQGYPEYLVDDHLRDYLERHLPKRAGRITGNSVRLDMNFMDYYLPRTMEWLHYRFLDVSGLSWFANTNFDIPYYKRDTSKEHTARGDVEQMIEELRHVHRELDLQMEIGRETLHRNDRVPEA